MIIGTAGHIDHGKTSLVRALTGVDTDRLPEEKRRGITIELGFAPLVIEGVGTVGIVDVPGHEAFVRTMLAGATGVDLALLVVAADEGVMPQTREHLAILSLLGVRSAVVALTKRDAADTEWVALVREDVESLLAHTPFGGAEIVETSTVTGEGIDSLRQTLRDRLREMPARSARDLFRMPIDRAFSVKGTGTVVTGTIWSGTVTPQSALRLFPADRPVRARGVQRHGAQAAELTPGTRGAIALAATDLDDVSRGGWLVEESAWVASRTLRADVALLDGVARPLRPREWVRLHLGTAEVGARVVASGGPLAPGETRGTRLVLDTPLVARAGDRFVLRLPSPPTTIGGGVVADPSPPHRRTRPWPTGLGPPERLRHMLEEAGDTGIVAHSLPVRLGLPSTECTSIVEALEGLVRGETLLFDARRVRALAGRMAAAADAYHAAHPLDEYMPRAALRAAVSAPDAITDVALAAAISSGTVEGGGGGVRRRGWSAVLTDALERQRDWLLERLRAAGHEPPAVSELRGEHDGNDPLPLLRNLEKDGMVVMVESDRYYAVEVVQDLVGRLRKAMEPERVYSPAELRALIGSSRKYLIPFLEFCDRQRITERRLNGRVVGV